ncbi:conserved hypothetical protein, partial [Ricinus communis]
MHRAPGRDRGAGDLVDQREGGDGEDLGRLGACRDDDQRGQRRQGHARQPGAASDQRGMLQARPPASARQRVARDRAGRQIGHAGLSIDVQHESVRALAAVHHDDDEDAVLVDGGGALQVLAARRAQHAMRAGTDEAAEVTEVVVGALRHQPVPRSIREHRRAAQVADVVRPAGLVEQQVPVDPADGPAVEVVDHAAGVALAGGPGADVRAAFLAAFGEEQLLVG